MAQQYVFDDGKAKTATGLAAFIDAVEAFGQSWQVLLFNADAWVLYVNMRAAAVAPVTNLYLAAVWAVFDGVKNQIGKGAAQLAAQ